MVAFLGSTAIRACFTGAALLAKRREYLFFVFGRHWCDGHDAVWLMPHVLCA
jgi:hypothetical protein